MDENCRERVEYSPHLLVAPMEMSRASYDETIHVIFAHESRGSMYQEMRVVAAFDNNVGIGSG